MRSEPVVFSDEELQSIHAAVFRDSVNSPGFFFMNLGTEIDSEAFRRTMVDLKEGLDRICQTQSNRYLSYQWLGRFNHQHTSMFHRDNAAPHSFLMLGYEPTSVESRVFVADYTRLIGSEAASVSSYFGHEEAKNTAPSDEQLAAYATELAPFSKNSYRLLLVNNSKSFHEPTYGVFHRGEVPEKVEDKDRVINSLMLNLGDDPGLMPDASEVLEFLSTDTIAR